MFRFGRPLPWQVRWGILVANPGCKSGEYGPALIEALSVPCQGRFSSRHGYIDLHVARVRNGSFGLASYRMKLKLKYLLAPRASLSGGARNQSCLKISPMSSHSPESKTLMECKPKCDTDYYLALPYRADKLWVDVRSKETFIPAPLAKTEQRPPKQDPGMLWFAYSFGIHNST